MQYFAGETDIYRTKHSDALFPTDVICGCKRVNRMGPTKQSIGSA